MENIFSYTSGHRLRVCLWALERARLGGRIWIEAGYTVLVPDASARTPIGTSRH
jgi:hypothetical protein